MADRWNPDRSRGIFETLLVVGGEPVELEAHLSRLARSLDAVYSQALPSQTEEELRSAAADIDLGRLRLTLAPAEDGFRVDLLAGGVDSETVFPERGVHLRTLEIGGGLGAHKWVDRKGINRPAPDEAGALIVDEGEILEAGWANVFAVRRGTLFTPPLDGRLLPGTTRAAVLEIAAAQGLASSEQPIHPSDLLDAEETFLTGSIRGIEPALSLDGAELPGCGTVSRRLADALRRRWNLSDDLGAPAKRAVEPQLGQLSQ
ncbi:MAG TPA: aminotransferase class IV [Solirubrobacterales bacterium]|nr:aminotransferase class IV [Solirubrobacterales bacterium]